MSAQRIVVQGPPLRAGIIGAYLACAGAKVIIALVGEEPTGSVLLRPELDRIHAEIGLKSQKLPGASKALGMMALVPEGPVTLPFSPYGMANAGVDFHHYWKRASALRSQPELGDYSLALALAGKADRVDLSRLPLKVGTRLSRPTYAKALLELAQQSGAKVTTAFDPREGDLIVDCGATDASPYWQGHRVRVASDGDLEGIEPTICFNAAKRLLALSADNAKNPAEQAEYTRLAQLEVERIEDMRVLLACEDPRATNRPSLKRKVDLFAACGRIPTEDFEVFSQPEWLAALIARGVRPRRHDRLANTMPEASLLEWLTALRQQINQIATSVRGS